MAFLDIKQIIYVLVTQTGPWLYQPKKETPSRKSFITTGTQTLPPPNPRPVPRECRELFQHSGRDGREVALLS